jgi:hypothetical protein
VRKLIAGPTVYICEECVEVCTDILAEEFDEKVPYSAERAAESTGARAMGDGVCVLCGSRVSIDVLVQIPKRGFLCFACLDAVRTATEPETRNGQ